MLQRIIAVFGYILACIIVVLGTVGLIAYGNGYTYDLQTGHLVRNGLVILSSTPGGAAVTVDGRDVSRATPYRRTLKAGEHTLALKKDGYQTWSKRISVEPSGVNLMQYVILLAQRLASEDLGATGPLVQTVPSTDHKKIALINPTGEAVAIHDIGSKSQIKVMTAHPASDTVPLETISSVTWSDDSSHLLVQSRVGATPQFYIVGINPAEAVINLTDVFKADLSGVVFNPSNWRELYWNSPEGLRRIDVSAGTVSGVLADHVLSFGFAADRIVYVDSSKPVKSLWLLDRSGHRQQIISHVPEGQSYSLDYSVLLGTPEIALTAQPAGTTMIYHDVLGSKPQVQAIPSVGDQSKFNSDGHYLLIWNAASLTSYTIEKNLTNTFPLMSGDVSGVSWFDNFHVLFDHGGQTMVAEFDGENAGVVAKSSDLPAFASNDERSVIIVSPASTSGARKLKSIKLR